MSEFYDEVVSENYCRRIDSLGTQTYSQPGERNDRQKYKCTSAKAFHMTLKNKCKKKQNVNKNAEYLIALSNKNKQGQIFIGLANAYANNVISPWNFLESFGLMLFKMQYCDWAIELFTAQMRCFFGWNKEKLCFHLAKHWSVKQTVNTFSRSYESLSILCDATILCVPLILLLIYIADVCRFV